MSAIDVVKAHIPSLSDTDEAVIEEMRWNSNVDRFGQPEYDVADLAIRTCHCGEHIGGFYEYADHLLDEFRKAGYE